MEHPAEQRPCLDLATRTLGPSEALPAAADRPVRGELTLRGAPSHKETSALTV